MMIFSMRSLLTSSVAILACNVLKTEAIPLNISDHHSIRRAAATVAYGLQSLYTGNQTGGVLGKFPYPPYYWWESGAAWGAMVNYWHYTGDDSYNNVTLQALTSQISTTKDFMVPAETFDEGNDDQAFWAIAAMSAAEYGFPEPPSPYPSWLKICENVFNDYVSRWVSSTCGGGLKWQIYPQNAGYTYKNSISNGGFFQLGARLARMTGNHTYLDWSEKVYNWTATIGLLDINYNVYDGADETINCSQIDHMQWTYNVGMYLYGAAVLQNYTNGSDIWTKRTTGLLDAVDTFISPYTNATDILFEAECEKAQTCDTDQYSMKGYLARWLASTSVMAPYTKARVGTILKASALGAASACSGGTDNSTCGFKWYIGGYDGNTGMGQELSALESLYTLLVNTTSPPKTQKTVHIRSDAVSTQTPLSAAPAPPMKTAIPLVGNISHPSQGGQNGGPAIEIRGLVIVLGMAILSAFILS